MPSRPSSKFLSRASVGDVVCSAYDLLTAAGQFIDPIKSPSTTQLHENETAVKDFHNAVSALLTIPYYLVFLNTGDSSVQEEPRVVP
jgi:hypothetical protein